jgi:hypothetical protein
MKFDLKLEALHEVSPIDHSPSDTDTTNNTPLILQISDVVFSKTLHATLDATLDATNTCMQLASELYNMECILKLRQANMAISNCVALQT